MQPRSGAPRVGLAKPADIWPSAAMKGMFTQGIVILTRQPVSLEELPPLLPEFPFQRTVPPNEHWEFGGATAVISYRPGVNGCVLIDTVARRWPDHMGDLKEESMLFGAWSMGHFGPLTYPGGLERATQQAWSWPEAGAKAAEHTSFLRVRLSYALGAGPEAKVMPQDCDPRGELTFLTDIVQCLLRHPAAICYFNPNGEVLASVNAVEKNVAYHREQKLPPLNVWSNVRLFNLPDDWLLMDSVGNWQLDTPDHEVVFRKDAFQPGDVDYFIRNATLYLLNQGPIIKDGNTMDGPGDVRWQATRYESGVAQPPREVMCWTLPGEKNIPSQVTQRARPKASAEAKPSTQEARPWWKRWGRK